MRFKRTYIRYLHIIPLTMLRKNGARRSELIYKSLSDFYSSMSLQPVMFLYALIWTIQIEVVADMALQKVCEHNFKYPWENCQNTSQLPEAIKMHKESDRLMYLSHLITNIPSIVLVLFLGPWSDRYGCKTTLILPFIGSTLATVIYIFNAMQWDMSAEILILAGFPRALAGGPVTLQMAAYSYISDNAAHESRTFLLGNIVLLYMLGKLLGGLLSDVVLDTCGHDGFFFISLFIFVFCIIYITLKIKDTRGLCLSGFTSSCNFTQSLLDVATIENLKAGVVAIQRQREGHSRARIWLYILTLCIIAFCTGMAPLEWPFINNLFGWPYVEYERFSLYDKGLGIFASFVFLFFFSYVHQAGDVVLATTVSVTLIIGVLLKGLAMSGWMIYLGATISLLPQVPLIAAYSAISKLVSHSEFGAIFGEMTALEALMPMVSTPLYSHLYTNTVEASPSAIYVFTAILTSITALTFLIIERLEKNRPGYQQI
ncbi:unnamed protein product, partial [Meganyctiphanes norvegica]